MAASAAFLTTCRAAIILQPEYTAFNTALSSFATSSRSQRSYYWQQCFDDGQAGLSPAYRLRAAIRGVVTSLQARNGVTDLDRETAVQTLCREYVGEQRRPTNAVEEAALLQQAIVQDMLS